MTNLTREPIAEPNVCAVPVRFQAETPKNPMIPGWEPNAEPAGTTPSVPVFPVPPLGGTGTDRPEEHA